MLQDDKQSNLDSENKELEVDTDLGDDVVFEENSEVLAPDYASKIAKLKSRIKELETKNTELLNGWQRERADAVNWKKREEESRKELIKFANSDIIAELLSVLDSFEAAFKNKEAWEKADKNWRLGVEYIHSQFLNVLTQNGLSVINPMGETYDSMRDEAVEMVQTEDESKNGKILEVVRVGYLLHGKELRAPKVRVGVGDRNQELSPFGEISRRERRQGGNRNSMDRNCVQSNIFERIFRVDDGRLLRATFCVYGSHGRLKARLVSVEYLDEKNLTGENLKLSGSAQEKTFFVSEKKVRPIVSPYIFLNTIFYSGTKPRAPTIQIPRRMN